ncbi:MAG: uncharacterized protein KVP18_005149 [Porospora cf. gigantea A]|uniref:uncharacterized protein n=1 Tax=Porospora cf. gigantea A TaxID=2853593 RepID=UPI00355ACB1F|nr:MAG: hypothetical protein KVP18_005149 [Porospora cf. gigantea A]
MSDFVLLRDDQLVLELGISESRAALQAAHITIPIHVLLLVMIVLWTGVLVMWYISQSGISRAYLHRDREKTVSREDYQK